MKNMGSETFPAKQHQHGNMGPVAFPARHQNEHMGSETFPARHKNEKIMVVGSETVSNWKHGELNTKERDKGEKEEGAERRKSTATFVFIFRTAK